MTPITDLSKIVSGGSYDATGITTPFVFKNLSNVTIFGLKVTGGDSTSPQNEGAAFRFEDCQNITLDHCGSSGNKNAGCSFIRCTTCKVTFGVFTKNGSNGLGFVNSSGCVVEDTLIQGNNRGVANPGWWDFRDSSENVATLKANGLVYMDPRNEGGGGKDYESSVSYLRCWFDDNGGVGSWMDWENLAHNYTDCWFTNNSAPPGAQSWTGIGMGYEADNGPLVLVRCYFKGNQNGGLAIQESRNVNATACIFDNNGIELRRNGDRIGDGGLGNVLIQSCGFINCTAGFSIGSAGGDNINFRSNTFVNPQDLAAVKQFGETGSVGVVTAPTVSPIGTIPNSPPDPTPNGGTVYPILTDNLGNTFQRVDGPLKAGDQIKVNGVLYTNSANVKDLGLYPDAAGKNWAYQITIPGNIYGWLITDPVKYPKGTWKQVQALPTIVTPPSIDVAALQAQVTELTTNNQTLTQTNVTLTTTNNALQARLDAIKRDGGW